jgi:hypothetical protein
MLNLPSMETDCRSAWEAEMQCAIVAALVEVVPQFVSSCVKALFENSATARGLKARAEIAEKKRLELEQKNRVYESEIRSLRQQVATERAGKHFAVVVLVLVMLFYHVSPFLGGLVLGIFYASMLLRLSTSVGQWAGNFIRQVPQALVRLFHQIRRATPHPIEQIRSRIRNWKWKAASVSGTFSTSH